MKLPCISNTQKKMIKYRNPKAIRIFLHGSSRAGLIHGIVGASNKLTIV